MTDGSQQRLSAKATSSLVCFFYLVEIDTVSVSLFNIEI